MSSPQHKVYAISGLSGTGKTTIGKILSKKYNYIFVDQDDFYFNKKPKIKLDNGLEVNNWDCIEAINWIALNNFINEKLLLNNIILVGFALWHKLLNFPIEKHIHLLYCNFSNEILSSKLESFEISLIMDWENINTSSSFLDFLQYFINKEDGIQKLQIYLKWIHRLDLIPLIYNLNKNNDSTKDFIIKKCIENRMITKKIVSDDDIIKNENIVKEIVYPFYLQTIKETFYTNFIEVYKNDKRININDLVIKISTEFF